MNLGDEGGYKIFNDTNGICHALFGLYEKEYEIENAGLDRNYYKIKRMESKRHDSGEVFRMNAEVDFEVEKNISAICDMRYDAGKACVVQFKKCSEEEEISNSHRLFGHFV
uniref:Astacin domain-containing protein n=1 Tax=Parastrongyloides trichosuri TaxID=131310 RepID=A0A0N4Z1J7_PARTI